MNLKNISVTSVSNQILKLTFHSKPRPGTVFGKKNDPWIPIDSFIGKIEVVADVNNQSVFRSAS